VAAARDRLAGQSHGGGQRRYGYQPDPETRLDLAGDRAKYHRRLVVVPEEAEVITQAATAILDRNVSLKAVAADLRGRGVPTASGAKWSAETLKGILLNESVTGLIDPEGNVVIPQVIPQDVQDRLRDLLAADSREVTGKDGKTYRVVRDTSAAGNAPRWLVSLIGTCGVCGELVKCTGGASRRAYCCIEHGHVRRSAVKVDELVTARVIALLKLELPHLLKPAPRQTADTGALRAEERKLNAKVDDLARLYAEGILSERGVRQEKKRIDERLAQIAAELAASDVTDPLPEFRDPDVDAITVWAGLGLARQRSIVKLLYDVVILPVGRRGGNVFDEDSVKITRKA
jgi:hypothetical protein